MSDILKVTPPLTQSDQPGRLRGDRSQEILPQTIKQTSPTEKADSQDVQSDRQRAGQFASAATNFESFLQMLRALSTDTPLRELLFAPTGSLVAKDLSPQLATSIAELQQMMQLQEGELVQLIRSCCTTTTKFQGDFFGLFRTLLHAKDAKPELKMAVLELLKRFDAMTSTNHTLKNIKANLQNIATCLPKSAADGLQQQITALSPRLANGDTNKTLEILKNEILPFLGSYISRSHDFGKVRNLVTSLTALMARLETGSLQRFEEAFRHAFRFSELRTMFASTDLTKLQEALVDFNGRTNLSQLQDKLLAIIENGLQGEAGALNKPAFQDMLQTMLLSQSVYLPLLHVLLPIQLGKKDILSELWIDPDGQKEDSSTAARQIRLLLRFEMKELGQFELILHHQASDVDIWLSVPEPLLGQASRIEKDFTELFSRNQLNCRQMTVNHRDKPSSLTEVFPKIAERRNGINVTV